MNSANHGRKKPLKQNVKIALVAAFVLLVMLMLPWEKVFSQQDEYRKCARAAEVLYPGASDLKIQRFIDDCMMYGARVVPHAQPPLPGIS